MRLLRVIFTVSVLSLMSHTAVSALTPVTVEERVQPDSTPSVRIDHGCIELSAGGNEPVRFEIFSITGQLIKSVSVKTVPVKIELPKGFYIVKCESWTRRVMLK